MGTRAHIAVKHSNNTVTWAYVHYDGYVASTGVLLQALYNSYEDACRLVDYYSIEAVTDEWRTIRSPGYFKHKRDRDPRIVDSANKIPYCEYVYLWQDGEWWIRASQDAHGHTQRWAQLAPLVTIEILKGNKHV